MSDIEVCSQHAHVQEAIRELKDEMKDEFHSINESIRRLSDMFSEIAIGKNDRELIRKALTDVLNEYKEVRNVIQELHIEKEQIIANSKLEHMDMRKDIDAAHEIIRNIISNQENHFNELKKNQNELMDEVRKMMIFRKTFIWIGAGISGILGAAAAETLASWAKALFGVFK